MIEDHKNFLQGNDEGNMIGDGSRVDDDLQTVEDDQDMLHDDLDMIKMIFSFTKSFWIEGLITYLRAKTPT